MIPTDETRAIGCCTPSPTGKERFPDSEQLGHLGGGTFACVRALSEPREGGSRTAHDEVTRVFAWPFRVDGQQISTEIKCGVACFPEDGRDANQLVQNAEAALKEARASGERYLHHRVEMNSELARRVGMEHRLRMALEKGQFHLYYQPKLTLPTARHLWSRPLLR